MLPWNAPPARSRLTFCIRICLNALSVGSHTHSCRPTDADPVRSLRKRSNVSTSIQHRTHHLNIIISDQSRHTDSASAASVPRIAQTASAYEQTASQHRINLPNSKMNASLQSAAAVNQRVAQLKKQNKTDDIKVDTVLWLKEGVKPGPPKKV